MNNRNNGLQLIDLDALPNRSRRPLPLHWEGWQYGGQVILDKPIRPTFPTALETLERRLTISNGVLGEEQLLVLPHFNAHAADFIEGDQVVLFCHTQADVSEPETHYTPDFFHLKGDWSFALNLDTQTCWAAGRGVARNRYFAWQYEPGKERFLKRPTDPFFLLSEKPTFTHFAQNFLRYLPHAGQGARNVFAEGYIDLRPTYKALMELCLAHDTTAGPSKERNFRAKPGSRLRSGDGLLD